MARFQPHGFVYILKEDGNPANYYKIGTSIRHPEDRYAEYRTGNPRNLVEVAVFPFAATEAEQIERQVHRDLRAYRVPGDSKEWFQLTDRQLDNVLYRLFRLMQDEWKAYMRREDVCVFASWGDNYRFGVLPVPRWLLAHREDTQPIRAVKENGNGTKGNAGE